MTVVDQGLSGNTADISYLENVMLSLMISLQVCARVVGQCCWSSSSESRMLFLICRRSLCYPIWIYHWMFRAASPRTCKWRSCTRRGCCLESLIFGFSQHLRGNKLTDPLLLIHNLCTQSVVIQGCSIASQTVLPHAKWMLSASGYISLLGFWFSSAYQHKL